MDRGDLDAVDTRSWSGDPVGGDRPGVSCPRPRCPPFFGGSLPLRWTPSTGATWPASCFPREPGGAHRCAPHQWSPTSTNSNRTPVRRPALPGCSRRPRQPTTGHSCIDSRWAGVSRVGGQQQCANLKFGLRRLTCGLWTRGIDWRRRATRTHFHACAGVLKGTPGLTEHEDAGGDPGRKSCGRLALLRPSPSAIRRLAPKVSCRRKRPFEPHRTGHYEPGRGVRRRPRPRLLSLHRTSGTPKPWSAGKFPGAFGLTWGRGGMSCDRPDTPPRALRPRVGGW